jgi:hypothetical protein
MVAKAEAVRRSAISEAQRELEAAEAAARHQVATARTEAEQRVREAETQATREVEAARADANRQIEAAKRRAEEAEAKAKRMAAVDLEAELTGAPRSRSAPPPSSPPALSPPLAELPDLSRLDDVKSALRQGEVGAMGCIEDADAASQVPITFESTGAVQSVRVSGWASGRPAAPCIAKAFQRVRVGAFANPSFTTKTTLRP